VAAVVSTGEVLQFPLLIKQGSGVTVVITVVDANGAPITNPAGWTAKAQIRVGPGQPVLFEWNTTPGPGIGTAVLTYNGLTGISVLTLTITSAESAGFTWTSAMWDCFLTAPGEMPACVAEGTVAVNPAITQLP
jgi:hypothetical protein